MDVETIGGRFAFVDDHLETVGAREVWACGPCNVTFSLDDVPGLRVVRDFPRSSQDAAEDREVRLARIAPGEGEPADTRPMGAGEGAPPDLSKFSAAGPRGSGPVLVTDNAPGSRVETSVRPLNVRRRAR